MEENVDSIKQTIRNEDVPIKKDNFEIDSPKEPSTLINKNQNDSNKEFGDKYSNKEISDNNKKDLVEESSKPLKVKPKKELPIEKKPFNEFINDHLLPSIIEVFKEKLKNE